MDALSAVASLAALAQDTRLAAFRLLVQAGHAGLPAGEVARSLGVPHNTLSTHLALLVRAGLVVSRRDGRQIIHAADFAAMDGLVGFLTENCCGRGAGYAACLPPAAPAVATPARERAA